jgi:hypothetical protein
LLQFAAGDRFDIGETPGYPALKQGLRVFAFEGLDRHIEIVTRCVDNVKRDYFCGGNSRLSGAHAIAAVRSAWKGGGKLT